MRCYGFPHVEILFRTLKEKAVKLWSDATFHAFLLWLSLVALFLLFVQSAK